MSAHLVEYEAARDRVDAAVHAIMARNNAAILCRRGCSGCCAPGLTVLPVEAAAIVEYLESHPIDASALSDGRRCCEFLDGTGVCLIYPVRPFLCRTHGVPLRTRRHADESRGLLRLFPGDVEVCSLNFAEAVPGPADVLDATTILALLITVDRRFRARGSHGAGEDERVPLRDLAHQAVASSCR